MLSEALSSAVSASGCLFVSWLTVSVTGEEGSSEDTGVGATQVSGVLISGAGAGAGVGSAFTTSGSGAGVATGSGANGLANAVEVLTTSMAVGLYSAAFEEACAELLLGRFPRASPAPRVVPKAPFGVLGAAVVEDSAAVISAAGVTAGWAGVDACSLEAARSAPVCSVSDMLFIFWLGRAHRLDGSSSHGCCTGGTRSTHNRRPEAFSDIRRPDPPATANLVLEPETSDIYPIFSNLL